MNKQIWAAVFLCCASFCGALYAHGDIIWGCESMFPSDWNEKKLHTMKGMFAHLVDLCFQSGAVQVTIGTYDEGYGVTARRTIRNTAQPAQPAPDSIDEQRHEDICNKLAQWVYDESIRIPELNDYNFGLVIEFPCGEKVAINKTPCYGKAPQILP